MADDLQRRLTAKERLRVHDVRSEIMKTVDEFVPATDASRIEHSLDELIALLETRTP